MTPRRQRMTVIGLVLAGVGVAVLLAFAALQESVNYFRTPTQVASGDVPEARSIRLGGMVADDSVTRDPGSLTVRFTVTDYAHSVDVVYTGVLPDLFREGQGVVTRGRMGNNGVFEAEEVLAKHDENYMPPEVKEALANAQKAQ
jgi:cytochrome c-type biogenesis protein CcmE